MSSSSPSAVTSNSLSTKPLAQWDVSRTAFDTFDLLRELVAAVSRDNVQPQAVLAAEALGSGLLVSPERIGDAIEALGGSKAMWLQSLEVSIGMSSGGTVRAVRESTSLLQFFLVATACKLCYVNAELGDLMFNMMRSSGVLTRIPVASSQLTRLIDIFSAHSEAIVPVDEMHEIAVAIGAQSPDADIYIRMSASVLADLLVQVFDSLRDDTVVSLTLTGHDHGIWLATLFLWLLPGETGLFIDGELVKGISEPKLSIVVEVHTSDPWRLQVWKTEGDPTSFVFQYEKDEDDNLAFLPIKLSRYYFDQYYLSDIDDKTLRERANAMIGELAGALICFFTENGKLFYPRSCCKEKVEKCSQVAVANVMSDTWTIHYNNKLNVYGWEHSVQQGQTRAHECLTKAYADTGSKRRKLPESEFNLKEICSSFIKENLGERISVDYILDPALYIAADAMVCSICDVVSGHRRLSPLNNRDLKFIDDFIDIVGPSGLDIYKFQRYAFAQLLPGTRNRYWDDIAAAADGFFQTHNRDLYDLVVAADGYVVGRTMLWKNSIRQSDVLSLRLLKGHIRKDDFLYDSIREIPFRSASTGKGDDPLILFQDGKYLGLEPRHETARVRFDTIVAVSASRLEVKHYFLYRDVTGFETRRRASWIESIASIATSTHLGTGYGLTLRQEENLARRLQERHLTAQWASAFNYHDLSTTGNIILRTSGKDELRFFTAGVAAEANTGDHGCCFTLIVRHSAPLLSCVGVADEKKLPWLIIC